MHVLNKVFNSETILYGIFGIATSILNIALFSVLIWMNMNYKLANFITLIITKLAAYVCNKKWVFKSKSPNFRELMKEFERFLIAREATMILDYIGLILLVELIGIDEIYGKIATTIVVIIINYFVGKGYVFRKQNNS